MKVDAKRVTQIANRWLGRFLAGRQPRQLGTFAPALIKRLPKDHSEVAARFVDKALVGSPKFQRLIWPINDPVHPALAHVMRRFKAEAESLHWPFFVHTGMRTYWAQESAFKAGHSKARPYQSPHQWGLAVDLVHFSRLWDLRPLEWETLAAVVRECSRKASVPLEWGGDWSFYDPAHWQLEAWPKYRVHFAAEVRGVTPAQRAAYVEAEHDAGRTPAPPEWAPHDIVRPKTARDWRQLDARLELHKAFWAAHPRVGV